MFDWMSISTNDPNTWDRIHNHDMLEFDDLIRHGEMISSKTKYKDIRIELWYRSRTVKLGFSPHKLYNDLHRIVNYAGIAMNHDTFTPEALTWVFKWLRERFAVHPENCRLHHIEFGVNLSKLSILTKKILDSLIVYAYAGKQAGDMPVKGVGYGRVFEFAQYKLKFYDKALQNMLAYNILRIEYKAKKIQAVKGIFGTHPFLSELLNPDLWIRCKNRIIAVTDYCIFDDEFGNHIHDRVEKWKNPREWKEMSSAQRSRERKRFEDFINQHGQMKIKKMIQHHIEEEVEKMLSS